MLVRSLALFAGGVALCVCWSIFTHPAPWGPQPFQMKWLSWNFIIQWDIGKLGATYGLWDETVTLRSIFVKQHQDRVKEERTSITGVPVVIYYPDNRQKNSLAFINFHGGGWFMGAADVFGASLATYAEQFDAVVVSVEYPMEPEATAQEIYESCYRVTTYFIQHASDWGVDPQNVILIGESAGATIAASLTLRMRDNNFVPLPHLQVLLYGVFQLIDLELPSHQQYAHGPIMHQDMLSFFYNILLTHDSSKYHEIVNQNRHVPISVRNELAKDHLNHDFIPLEQKYPPYKAPQYKEVDTEFWNKFKDMVMDPYVSPLIADSHANLSEAIIVSSQYDNIRDDSFLYARRLRNAGVPVTLYTDPVGVHSICHFSEFSMSSLITVIRSALFE